jgi:hypothetical protein
VEKKLAEECHFAVNKVEDMEKESLWSIRVCPLEMETAKGSSPNNVGFASLHRMARWQCQRLRLSNQQLKQWQQKWCEH